jgi:hypothetical protein
MFEEEEKRIQDRIEEIEQVDISDWKGRMKEIE